MTAEGGRTQASKGSVDALSPGTCRSPISCVILCPVLQRKTRKRVCAQANSKGESQGTIQYSCITPDHFANHRPLFQCVRDDDQKRENKTQGRQEETHCSKIQQSFELFFLSIIRTTIRGSHPVQDSTVGATSGKK
jgi:hypothetical protein